MEDAAHLNMHQKTNANTTISNESKDFAEKATAKVLALFAQPREVAMAA